MGHGVRALLLLTVALLGACQTAGDQAPPCRPEAQLRMASFNIRYGFADASSQEDENGWLNAESPRRDRVTATIEGLNADVVGVQEALAHQVEDLREALPGYGFVGVGRDDGETAGEYAGIFYRRNRLREVRSGHFWLSDTPDEPGTVFEGSAATRMASWVLLEDLVAGRELLFVNTHWDHVSGDSRLRSATLIRERLATLVSSESGQTVPAILTGDLNTVPGAEDFERLLTEEPHPSTALIDGFRQVHERFAVPEGTFHNFTGTENLWRIDFVLHTAGLATVEAEIDRRDFDGLYPSDHFPVLGVLAWTDDGLGGACPGYESTEM